MEHSVAQLVGSLAGVGVAVALIAAFAFAVMWPLMLFSMMRSMKGIRRELVELNETISRKLPM